MTILFPLIFQYLGYILGFIALLSGAGALKWWIIALLIGNWWSRGAISMALQGKALGELPKASLNFTIAVHWIVLIALYTCSIIAIAS
jgi:hypothetical protein